MQDHLSALHVSSVRRNSTTDAPKDAVPDVPEEDDNDEEFEILEVESISSSQSVYTTAADVRILIEALLKVQDETVLQCFIEDSMNQEVYHLLKDSKEKAVSATYTELSQTFEQAAAK